VPDVKPEPGDLLVILRPAEGGGYTVLSPDIPGLVTEGANVPHALGMAADAAGELERAKQPEPRCAVCGGTGDLRVCRVMWRAEPFDRPVCIECVTKWAEGEPPFSEAGA
jgi:predicted RNase H-like HicB family nuclease